MTTTRLVLASLCTLLLGCGQQVKMIEVEPTNLSLNRADAKERLRAKALDSSSMEVPGVVLAYSSENEQVARVSSDGVVEPTGNGSTVVVVRSPEGVTGEVFIKVCLPKALACDPPETLKLKVGLAAPIKCKMLNCKDEPIPATITLTVADPTVVLQDPNEPSLFTGLRVAETVVTAKGMGLERKITIPVAEQDFLPGMEPGAGGGKGGGKKEGGNAGSGGGGRFDHILNNMKFN